MALVDLPAEDAKTAQAAAALLTGAYMRNRRSLWSFLRFKTGNDSAADDLLQDLWLRLTRVKPGALRDPDALLRVIARNMAADWHRHEAMIGRHSAPLELADGIACDRPSAFDELASRQAMLLLIRIIGELPPRRRKAFLLHRFEGLRMVEVAARMGITAGTVERQIAMALTHCQQRLVECGWAP